MKLCDRSAGATGWLVLLSLLAAGATAYAHPLAPSLLELREAGNGRVEVLWRTPLMRPSGTDVEPSLPQRCHQLRPPVGRTEGSGVSYRWEVDCGLQSLVGSTVGVTGLRESKTNALLRITLEDGGTVRALLGSAESSLVVPAAQRSSVLPRYLALGVDHLFTGLDHLLFVTGLVLLVRDRRALLFTITSFTAGHSVTLSLAALGFVSFPPGPIEAAIAFTILFLAAELARGPESPPTLTRRYPWVITFAFGLLHGLGFAGALTQVGLPAGDVPLALLSFNAGIELGQLAVVAIVLTALLGLRPLSARWPAWSTAVPAYAIGSLAAYWCFDRLAGIL